MARIARRAQQTTGCYYHVMNRGHNREVVFQSDDDHRQFLELIDRYRRRFPLQVYHYCLLSGTWAIMA